MSTQSRMADMLKGKVVNGKVVSDVRVDSANMRKVTYTDGTVDRISKPQLLDDYNREAAKVQKSKMARSMRTNPDGGVDMTIGGSKQGTRKTYKTKQGAKRALDRKYGK